MEHRTELVILASEGGSYHHGGVARHVNEITKVLSKELSVTVVVVPSYCITNTPAKDSVVEETCFGARFIYVTCVDYVHCLRSGRFEMTAYMAAVEKMHDKLAHLLPKQLDAILLEDHYEAGLAFSLLSRCRRAGFVNFAHLPLSARFSYFEKGVDESRQQILEAAAMIGSSAIVTPSCYSKRTVRNVYPVSNGRIFVAPLAVNNEEQEPLRLENRPKTVMTVARFSDQKGWNSFLAVAKLVEISGAAPTWHLVGDGVNREKVLGYLSAFVPQDRIRADRYLGADSQLPEAMQESAVFFLPSSYETFGLAPLEAASNGAVPVVSGIGGLEEIWGPHGMTFSPGDVHSASSRIVALLNDGAYRVAQANLAHKVTRTFNWDAHCAQLKDILFAQ